MPVNTTRPAHAVIETHQHAIPALARTHAMPCRSPIRCVCLLQHLIALDITVATCLHMLLLCACRCLLSSRSPARIDGMAPACALTAEPVGIASDVVRLRSDTIELSAYCLLDPLHAVLSSPQPRCFCAPARALVARVLCAAPLVLACVRHARRSAACFRRLLRARSVRCACIRKKKTVRAE